MPSLKKRSEFHNLREHGQFQHINHWLSISYKKNKNSSLRWGWTLSRKLGSAVTRNKLKRWGREFLRECRNNDFDINFIFKIKGKDFYKNLSHQEFDHALYKAFKKMH